MGLRSGIDRRRKKETLGTSQSGFSTQQPLLEDNKVGMCFNSEVFYGHNLGTFQFILHQREGRIIINIQRFRVEEDRIIKPVL